MPHRHGLGRPHAVVGAVQYMHGWHGSARRQRWTPSAACRSDNPLARGFRHRPATLLSSSSTPASTHPVQCRADRVRGAGPARGSGLCIRRFCRQRRKRCLDAAHDDSRRKMTAGLIRCGTTSPFALVAALEVAPHGIPVCRSGIAAGTGRRDGCCPAICRTRKAARVLAPSPATVRTCLKTATRAWK